MRRVWRYLPWLIVLYMLAMVSGCATLPRSMPLSDTESDHIRHRFLVAMEDQERCGSGIDADVTVTYNSFLQSGAATGYIQAKSPSSIKFIAENPFGQPLLALFSNGRRFILLSVMERLAYAGEVAGETFRKYAPPGFRPDESFYWLTGRLNNTLMVHKVGRRKDGPEFWLEVTAKASDTRHLVLFDPTKEVILRHMMVDEHDRPVFDVSYDEYSSITQNDGNICRLPGLVTVSSGSHRARLEIRFRNWAVSETFPDSDFEPMLPEDFQIVQVL